MSFDPLCPRCSMQLESIMHILRDCDEATQLWNVVVFAESWSIIFSLGLLPWMEWNLSSNNIGVIPWSWFSFFSVAVSSLWKDRNNLIFSQSSKMVEELWQEVVFQTKSIEFELANPPQYPFLFIACVFCHYYCHIDYCSYSFLHDGKLLMNISWKTPPDDYIKVNVDGAHNRISGTAACGGIPRKSDGSFIKGFVCNMGSCSVLRAELHPLLYGIEVFWNLSFEKVIFETNSLAVFNYVSRGSSVSYLLKSLVDEISELLRKSDWQASL